MQISTEKKRVLLLVGGVVAILIIVTAFLSFWGTSREYIKNLGLIPGGNTGTQIDTDKDGLTDVEEIFWGTNPEDPDTDNDGTRDGVEILQNRNPWIAGPNDALEDNPAFPQYNDIVRSSTSTTERMLRRLAVNYEELKARGIPLTDNLRAALVISSLDEVQNAIPQIGGYHYKDIVVHENNSTAALRAYGVTVANIIEQNTPREYTNEYLAVLRALETDDDSNLEDLDPVVRSYQDIRDELLTLSVPSDAQHAHLHLINSAEALQHIINLMSEIDSDPAIGFIALDNYRPAVDRLVTSFKILDELFTSHNITFGTNENASMFSAHKSTNL